MDHETGLFRIELFDRWSHQRIEGERASYGRITFGRGRYDYETFIAPLSFWTAAHYRRHWRESLQRLVDGAESTRLMVWAYNPQRSSWLQAWDLWREGPSIDLRNQFLFVDSSDDYERNLPDGFDMRKPWIGMGERPPYFTEEGERISRWTLETADIERFLAAPDPHAARVWPIDHPRHKR